MILLVLALYFIVLVGRRWRCSECFAKDDALKTRVLSFGVQEVFWMNFLVSRINRRLLWLGRRCCLVAALLSRVVSIVIRYLVTRCRTVSFDFLTIFPFVDDDYFRVATNVDNIVSRYWNSQRSRRVVDGALFWGSSSGCCPDEQWLWFLVEVKEFRS